MNAIIQNYPPIEDPAREIWAHPDLPMTTRGRLLYDNIFGKPTEIIDEFAFNENYPIKTRINAVINTRLFLKVKGAPEELVDELIRTGRGQNKHFWIKGNFDPDDYNVPFEAFDADAIGRLWPFNASIKGECVSRRLPKEQCDDHFFPSIFMSYHVQVKNSRLLRGVVCKVKKLFQITHKNLVGEVFGCKLWPFLQSFEPPKK